MIIWLASYPRSGNTLLRTMLYKSFGLNTYSVHVEGDDKDFGENHVLNMVGHVRGQDPDEIIEIAKNSPDLYLIKTHQAPLTDDPAIYVVRDGRAVVVSYTRYTKDLIKVPETLETMIEGVPFCGSWTSHFHDWEPETRPNTLLLRFEDMTADANGTIDKIAEFIGRKPVAEYDLTFEKLNQAEPKFFRSGSNAKNVADLGEHIAHFTAAHGELMVRLGYMTEAEQGRYLRTYVDQLRSGAVEAGNGSTETLPFLSQLGEVLKHHTETLERIEQSQATLFGISHDVIAANIAEQFAASRDALQRVEVSQQVIHSRIEQLGGGIATNMAEQFSVSLDTLQRVEVSQQVIHSRIEQLGAAENEHFSALASTTRDEIETTGLLVELESQLVGLANQTTPVKDSAHSTGPLKDRIASLVVQVRQVQEAAATASARLNATKRLLVKRAARRPRLLKGSHDRGIRAILETLPPIEQLTTEQLDSLVSVIGEQEDYPTS